MPYSHGLLQHPTLPTLTAESQIFARQLPYTGGYTDPYTGISSLLISVSGLLISVKSLLTVVSGLLISVRRLLTELKSLLIPLKSLLTKVPARGTFCLHPPIVSVVISAASSVG